ncbi:hypothetical protein TRIP_B350384 [uncultured Desulfatiglans sp.]|uniref:Uncharacterized protein n=1 Tax=Uncultured Desulfatiglans sp. TaxID=1748965 RepID=A0A653ACS0_UNCDX|nr:hypothetical protein TRIP_B350384 [uncultured Desulfatiglans sp.]
MVFAEVQRRGGSEILWLALVSLFLEGLGRKGYEKGWNAENGLGFFMLLGFAVKCRCGGRIRRSLPY